MNKKPLGVAAEPSGETTSTRGFRWRTRVKIGTPEFGGTELESLPSHVADDNAHPQYLKKGQAVPTGQEYTIMAKHNSYLLAHMRHLARRDELIRTKLEYQAVMNDEPYVDNANNYSKTSPARHIVTAHALKEILDDYQKLDSIIRSCGDGTNLIYIDANGTGRVSDKNIGSTSRPVYLKNGMVTQLPYDAVLTATNQTIDGRKTFSTVPRLSSNAAYPVDDVDLVNVGYLKQALRIPIGFHVITDRTITDASTVNTKLGYGTWSLAAEVGNVGYMWVRTA